VNKPTIRGLVDQRTCGRFQWNAASDEIILSNLIRGNDMWNHEDSQISKPEKKCSQKLIVAETSPVFAFFSLHYFVFCSYICRRAECPLSNSVTGYLYEGIPSLLLTYFGVFFLIILSSFLCSNVIRINPRNSLKPTLQQWNTIKIR
jgi:hypothetical protein